MGSCCRAGLGCRSTSTIDRNLMFLLLFPNDMLWGLKWNVLRTLPSATLFKDLKNVECSSGV